MMEKYMMNVSNRKCIRRLSVASFKAAKIRNMITILAIALTTILFTTIFTVGMSMKYGYEQSNFRQTGGYAHGAFKYLTREQTEEIKEDSLIKEYGLRMFCGMPNEMPFHKSHVEVSYCDANEAKYMFLNPIEGRLPEEGTNEAATDLRVLSLLGVEPVIGNEFTMTFLVDGKETTETFTLCGYWDYDDVIVANHVLIPLSRVEEIFEKLDTQGNDGMTTYWSMDVMFANSRHIRENIETILARHGYQNDAASEEGFIRTGVNWGYLSAGHEYSVLDTGTVLALAAVLLLIIFTGYLIIYNIFQISVSNDVRFYGLLKTIGTTGRQIKRLIFMQAILLSMIGIPIGLVIGYGAGLFMTRIVVAQLNGIMLAFSVSPVIFVGSALFALVTVWLSLRKPCRMAARISPVEAVRYTEGSVSKRGRKKGEKGASIFRMAVANLGRNKSKTVITVISMSFAIVLLNITFILAKGFDMDKYLTRVKVDFLVADAAYFQAGSLGEWIGLPEEVISQIETMENVTGGRTYGKKFSAEEYVTEAWVRQKESKWRSAEQLDSYIESLEKVGNQVADRVQIYGMEDFVLDKITLLEGDIEKLKGEGNYVAAVYDVDDYGIVYEDSNWAKLGDEVTIRYIDGYEYYNPETGEIYEEDQDLTDLNAAARAREYREVTYEVAATIVVPHTLGYRYYGADQFVMGADTFLQDSGTETGEILYYAFDCADDRMEAMEQGLSDYIGDNDSLYDYESKKTYAEEFYGFQNMFMMGGLGATFIVGMVGILNFLNTILTGILARKREFAVLQSVGMTGRQLNRMLITEGMVFAGSSIVITLALSIAMGPMIGSALEGMFPFFAYHLSVTPILMVAPIFLLFGALIPFVSYRQAVRKSVVERLREAE